MILFVGDRPSKYTDPDHPFKGARCEPKLLSWIKQLSIDKYRIINRVDPDFEIVIFVQMVNERPIIALGNNASKALKHYKHFKLPHPSGRNRKLNDKEYEISILKQCKEWLEASCTK